MLQHYLKDKPSMKILFYLAAVLFAGVCLALFWGCTKAPFGEDEISAGSRQIRGRVELSRNLNPQGVFVWLDGVGVGTRTDKNGQFTITLPSVESQSARGGTSGAFNLYFYLANFELITTSVVLRNGVFVYPQGEINKDGELSRPKLIPELLHIDIAVTPSVMAAPSIRDTVLVEAKLSAVSDSATVVFPKSIPGRFGALFFRNISSGAILVFPLFPALALDQTQIIGKATYTTIAVFYPGRMRLPPGKYEIIPYLLVKHEPVPPALIASLGDTVEALGPNYLMIPFRREGGSFELQ
jgi:hypothetical protein